jgi:hypothetical protein
VAGDLSLAGDLAVNIFGNFALGDDQNYLIVNVSGTRTGEFNGLGEGSLVGNFTGRDLYITYAAGDGNDVALFTAIAPPTFTADFDGDDDVDGKDLTSWTAGFGSGNASHMQGDADGDQDVDGADFLAWQREVGSVAAVPAATTVPELASMWSAMIAAAVLGLQARSEKRQRSQLARSLVLGV